MVKMLDNRYKGQVYWELVLNQKKEIPIFILTLGSFVALGIHHLVCYYSRMVFVPGNVVLAIGLLFVMFCSGFYCLTKHFYLTWKLMTLMAAEVVLALVLKFALFIPTVTLHLSSISYSALVVLHVLLQFLVLTGFCTMLKPRRSESSGDAPNN
jgi:hypothetical protein